MVHKPAWFRNGSVFVSYAPTVGINKDGEELFVVNPETGLRTNQLDDQLEQDVRAIVGSLSTTETSRWVKTTDLTDRLIAVPVYFDDRSTQGFTTLLDTPEMSGFEGRNIGNLIDDGALLAMHGHGSPSADLRTGNVPYIKVSDIRAGQVNINPTNRVSEITARRFWKGTESGLCEYDLITPIRTSKNIGEFAVIMPGQERVVLTKEVLVLRAAEGATFDNFYLLWALTLKAVRRQWDRIVFMQTNREDVGQRYREIKLPIPPSREVADAVSKPFRDYYLGTRKLRDELLSYLTADDKHHIFMSSSPAELDDGLADYDDE